MLRSFAAGLKRREIEEMLLNPEDAPAEVLLQVGAHEAGARDKTRTSELRAHPLQRGSSQLRPPHSCSRPESQQPADPVSALLQQKAEFENR